MLINALMPRRGRGLIAVVCLSSISALATATLGSVPAVGSTPSPPAPGRGTGSPIHDRGQYRVPGGLSGGGSIGLGIPGSGADKVDRNLAGAKGNVDVMIELDAAPASRAFGLARVHGTTAASKAARSQTTTIKRDQSVIESHLASPATSARTLYRSHALYAGIAVNTDASRLKALAALPGVKAIHRITPKSPTNGSSVPLIGAPAVWKGRGDTGQNERVGIIDTGIDYTHADFGGPGTTAAYATAKASPTFTPTAKVVGGYDFAGDLYNSDSNAAGYDPTPSPDPNPVDCEGHGSHVAGTVAGLGVTTAGATYTGGYASDIDPATMSIGPGVAPGAKLYALKVLGCSGSTSLLGQALDWAADPNGDGDVSDHLDVVNMSLGSDYASPQDPDAVAANNLAALGTVVVAAIGNGGDVYEVGGSPGNAPRVLGVAASDDGNNIVDGLKIDSPAAIEPADTVDGHQDNVFGGLKSVAYNWMTGPGVTNTEVFKVGDWTQPESSTNNIDGCDPYSIADATKIAGKIVLQKWIDGTGRRCGSAPRAANAHTAGAAGVIYGSDVNSFSAGVSGTADIPAMLTVNQATTAILAKLNASPTPVPVFATMTNALRNSVTIIDAGAVDKIADFSSRGVGIAGDLKPDVTAPGVTTFSVAMGTGNEGIAESGTSMATPHVAGEAALVRAAHPGYSVEQVKAAIMNTANQDVFVGPGHTGNVYGPERVGSGRVNADQAVATTTLAYVKDDPGAVSVSFGPVAVTRETTRLTKTVRVVNTRPTSSASYTIGYLAAHPTPGVTYTFRPSEVTVPAGGSADILVTETITRSALRAVPDPTTSPDPLAVSLKRSYRTDASGRMILTPIGTTTGLALRVPIWSAPRPAAVMQAAPRATVSGPTAIKYGYLPLAGLPVSQGSSPTGYQSSVSTFQLQATSPMIASCSVIVVTRCIAFHDDRSADLRYVGSASDSLVPSGADPTAAGALLSFGISSFGPWRTPSSYTEFDVRMDTDADGIADAAVFNTRLTTTAGFDYFVSELIDLRFGPTFGKVLGFKLVNDTDGSFDTNIFNSDSLTLPVSLRVMRDSGLVTGDRPQIRYWVQSFSAEAGQVDSVGSPTAPLTVTVGSPALAAYGNYGTRLSDDTPGTKLLVRRDDASYASDKPLGLLLIHHLNTDLDRAQVVAVKAASAIGIRSSTASYTRGGKPVFTATISPPMATGTVSFRENGRVVKTVAVAGGKATWQATGQLRGKHTMSALYGGDAVTLPSTSAAVDVTVKGLPSRTALSVNNRNYAHWRRIRPVLTATMMPSRATGKVTFRDGAKALVTAAVRNGQAAFRVPLLTRGRHSVTATYTGSGSNSPSTSAAVVITVR